MNNFKFRAYRKDTNVIIYFSFGEIHSTKGYNGWSSYVFDNETDFERNEIDIHNDSNVEITEYIGLKDRSGQLIYEGDILEVSDFAGGKISGVVNFFQGEVVIEGKHTLHSLKEYYWDCGNEMIKVLGNKFKE